MRVTLVVLLAASGCSSLGHGLQPRPEVHPSFRGALWLRLDPAIQQDTILVSADRPFSTRISALRTTLARGFKNGFGPANANASAVLHLVAVEPQLASRGPNLIVRLRYEAVLLDANGPRASSGGFVDEDCDVFVPVSRCLTHTVERLYERLASDFAPALLETVARE